MPSSFDGIPLSFRKSTMAALSASSSSLEKRLPLSAGSDWPPHWRFLAPSTPVDALRLLAPEPAALSARLRFLGGALSFFAWASLAFLTASAALALASFFALASLAFLTASAALALASLSALISAARCVKAQTGRKPSPATALALVATLLASCDFWCCRAFEAARVPFRHAIEAWPHLKQVNVLQTLVAFT